MNREMKDFVNNLDRMKIAIDEPFSFNCTMCGKCCINREDILLTPRDIYRMAKELKVSVKEFFMTYCEAYIGEHSRVTIIRLKPRGSIRRCPLLKDRKCSVHNAKPSVCAMFPIGRIISLDKNCKPGKELTYDQVEYIFVNPDCGDDSKMHTVREWFDVFGIPIKDEFFITWQNTVTNAGAVIRNVEKYRQLSTLQHLLQTWESMLIFLYLNYDTGKDFMKQFRENKKKFEEELKKLSDLADEIKKHR